MYTQSNRSLAPTTSDDKQSTATTQLRPSRPVLQTKIATENGSLQEEISKPQDVASVMPMTISKDVMQVKEARRLPGVRAIQEKISTAPHQLKLMITTTRVPPDLTGQSISQGMMMNKRMPVIQRILAAITLGPAGSLQEEAADGPMIASIITARDGDLQDGGNTRGGPHATAFIIFEQMVVEAVSGKSYRNAAEAMRKLVYNLRDLPGLYDPRSVEIFERATRLYESPVLSNPMDVAPSYMIPNLQNAIVEYLKIRNSLPATINRGKNGEKTDTAREANMIYWLREAMKTAKDNDWKDQGGAIKQRYVNAMMHGFDETAFAGTDDANLAAEQHWVTCLQIAPIENEKWRKTILSKFKMEAGII